MASVTCKTKGLDERSSWENSSREILFVGVTDGRNNLLVFWLTTTVTKAAHAAFVVPALPSLNTVTPDNIYCLVSSSWKLRLGSPQHRGLQAWLWPRVRELRTFTSSNFWFIWVKLPAIYLGKMCRWLNVPAEHESHSLDFACTSLPVSQ